MKNTDTNTFTCSTSAASHLARPAARAQTALAAAWRLVLLCCVLGLGLAAPAQASHFRYGDIAWRVVQSDVSGRTIEFKVNAGWRLGAANPISLDFGDGTSANANIVYANINNAYDYGTGTVQHHYNANGNFTVSYSGCCKISNLQNNHDGNWYLSSVVNVGGGNSSPVSTVPAVVNMPIGLAGARYIIPAADPDGRVLTFSLAGAAQSWPGVQPSGLSINAQTGEIIFNTVGKAVGQLWNAGIAISNGRTTVVVDFIIQMVQQSNPPQFDYSITPANQRVINASPGQAVNFTVKATDIDVGSTVRLSAVGVPPGAAISPAFGGYANPVQHTFSWTPAASQFGTFVVNFVAESNVGAQTSTSVSIIVSLKPRFDVPPTPAAGVTNIYAPGQAISHTIQASNTDPTDLVRIINAQEKASNGTLTALPAGAGLSPLPTPAANPTTGTFTWTPVASNWGEHTVVFTAEESRGEQMTHEVKYLINTVPAFASAPVTRADVGQPYTYSISASDADLPYGDAVNFVSATVLPAWLTLTTDPATGTAVLAGTPPVSAAGTLNIRLMAEDVYHHEYTSVPEQAFAIVVNNCTVRAVSQDVAVTLDANGQASVAAAQVDNGSTASCGIASLTVSPSTFSCANVGTNSVTLTVTDVNGNVSTTPAVVTVQDVVAPTAVAQNITVKLDANGQATISAAQLNNGSFDNCGPVSVGVQKQGTVAVLSQASENNILTLKAPAGALFTAVTFASYGTPYAMGNTFMQGSCHASSSQSQVEAYVLNQNTASIPATNAVFGDPCVGTYKRLAVQATYTEGAPTPQLSYSCANVGQNPVLLTIIDASGNTSTVSAIVTVLDAIAPSAVAQNATVQLDANGAASITAAQINNGSADNCSVVSVTVSPSAFTCANTGANAVTLTVTDASGNVNTASATVTVTDVILPTITAPAAVSVSADHGQCSASGVALGTATAADNCAATVINNAPATFPKGTTTVTWTATDGSGNVATATQTVTVTDNELPTITAPAAVTASTDAGQCSATGVSLGSPVTGDNCAGVTVTNNALAVFAKGSTTVTWTATDAAGNKATATQVVTVNDTEKPVLTVPAAMVASAPATQCGAAVTFNPTATDNCTAVTVVASPASGSTFPVGTNTVKVTATDVAGNSSTGSFTITVNDVTAPTVATRTVTVTLVNGAALVTTAQVDNGSSDACGIASFSLNRTAFTCANLGNNPVTLTVTDVHGNAASAPAVVVVTGSIPAPAIAVTPSSNVYTGGVATNLYLGYGAQSATLTATGGVSYAWSPATGLSSSKVAAPVFTATTAGTFTYTVTATNQYGCTATATVVLHVIDARCGTKFDKVVVCHNGHETCLSPNAVDAQLTGHPGDKLGACGSTPAARPAAATAPTEALLFEAFPNPFGASTTVHFRPAVSATAQVRVYDALGRVVATLFNGTAEAGHDYSLTLSAEQLANGLYLCRYESQGQVQTQRLSVAK